MKLINNPRCKTWVIVLAACVLFLSFSFSCIASNPADTNISSLKSDVDDTTYMFPKWDVHFGPEVTDFIHIGARFRIHKDLVELNIAPIAPILTGVFSFISPGINLPFDRKHYIFLNFQVPFWILWGTTNTIESEFLFPSLNIGWFNEYNNQNFLIRGGVSYLFELYELVPYPKTPFFNLGIQLGFSNNPSSNK